MDINERLRALSTDASVDQKTRIERYKALLAELLKGDTAALKAFVTHVTSEDVALVVSRQVLLEIAAGLPSLPAETLKDVGSFALERIQPRVTSFEEQVSTIREHLAEVYEREEEWSTAVSARGEAPHCPRSASDAGATRWHRPHFFSPAAPLRSRVRWLRSAASFGVSSCVALS